MSSPAANRLFGALLVLSAFAFVTLSGRPAAAVPSCGGQVSQAQDCGKSDIYPCCPNGGNCTWWAWESVCRNWHIALPNWGNANTWAGHAKLDPAFDVVGSPVPGCVATRDLGAFGHVAWVTAVNGSQITVTEENCCTGCAPGMGTRNYSASYFDSGYVVRHGTECSCSPGDKQTQACNCGTRTRSCGGCDWGDWSACTGDPEICDGVDNDCNGVVDDGHPQTLGATPPDFAATLVDVSYPQSLRAGATATVWADFRNVGVKPWPKEGVWMGAHGAAGGGASAFFVAGAWPSWNVTTVLDAPVLPGDVGRFTFEVKAPATPGADVAETFQLQLPGGAFIACPTADITPSIRVLPGGDGAGGAGGAGGAPPSEGAATASTPSGCSQSPSTGTGAGAAALTLALLFLARARRRAVVALLAAGLPACSSPAPAIRLDTVSPARVSARGGETLTLRGSGFTKATEVRLGGEPVKAFTVVSSSEATFEAPPLFAGSVDVKATAGAQSAELPSAVEVLPLDLRFVEAPPYALPGAPDAGAPQAVTGAALADFDGDGDADLVTCSPGEACRFLANDGNGNFTDSAEGHGLPRFPAAMPDTRGLVAADLDGDGDLDLLLGLGTAGPGAVYRNDGRGVFTDAGPDALPADMTPFATAAAGDLDGDGLPDLVIGSATAGAPPLRVYFNAGKSGALRFQAAAEGAVPSADWQVSAITLADFDGDGHLDVLIATSDAADGIALRMLRNVGGKLQAFPAGLPDHLPGTVRALAAGDVSGDGAPDLVVSGDGQDRLFINDGSGHFFDATLASMPLDTSKGTSIALVDLDRDRDLDLLIGNDGAQTRLYLNDGTGVFSDHTPLLPVAAAPTVWVGAADVDGDAAQDLLVINAAPAPARLYLSVEPLPDDAH